MFLNVIVLYEMKEQNGWKEPCLKHIVILVRRGAVVKVLFCNLVQVSGLIWPKSVIAGQHFVMRQNHRLFQSNSDLGQNRWLQSLGNYYVLCEIKVPSSMKVCDFQI